MVDHEYVAARMKLIPEAEKTAHHVAGKAPTGTKAREAWCITWNKTFHSTMDALARQAGLIR